MAATASSGEPRLRLMQALQTSLASGQSVEPAWLARLLVEHLREQYRVDGVGLAWHDPASGQLRLLAHNFPWVAEPTAIVGADLAVVGQSFTRGEPVVVEDCSTLAASLRPPIEHGIASCVAIPVRLDDRVLGVLALATRQQRRFEPSEINQLALIATQVGIVLETSRRLHESELRRQEAEALADLVRSGAIESNADRVLALIAERACRLLGSDYCAAILEQPGGLPAKVATWGCQRSSADADALALDADAIAHVVAARPMAIEVLHGDDAPRVAGRFPIHRHEGGKTAVTVPLLSREAVIGVLVFGWRTVVSVTPDRTQLIEVLAGYAATILDNALTHDREVHLAREAADRAASLTASELQIRSLYEAVACGILVRDPSGRIVQANAAAEEMLGITTDQMRGRTSEELWAVFAEDGRRLSPSERPGMLALQTRQSIRNFTMGIRLSSGERRWFQITSVPMFAPDGTPLQVVSSFIDVTRRKEAEEQLRSLAQTEKLRALGQMASGVAHDLNQCLGLIIGHGELAARAIERGEDNPAALLDSLRTIIQAATDGAETIKRLLTFTRARRGVPLRRVALGDVLHDVARLTAPQWGDAAQAEGRQIALDVSVEGDTTIDGSPEGLREAFTNLVFNAIDALPRGGTIRLTARRRGDRVEAEVVDSGIGIADDVRGHVFEPFFTTKGEHGTGLGLSVVFGVVQQHHGQISLDSTPGHGTAFRLTFAAVPPAAPRSAPRPPASEKRTLRILAVDDELPLARMVALMLGPEGHRVDVATSGEDAVRLLEERAYDLVISDVGMEPGMSGLELAKVVRHRWPDTRVCLATGWGAQIDEEAARALGVETIVAKPYGVADLRRLADRA